MNRSQAQSYRRFLENTINDENLSSQQRVDILRYYVEIHGLVFDKKKTLTSATFKK